ncbi:ComEC/Rec2 family competence protein [Lacisediminihabitans profunda]|uniref:MBL fold metallo-hydrolase n=1 Tax=Lacisediminihabitans profunda TaxID=2594790 RepID=A0A5C8UW52_9MICO|nr:ComEC/Rec2 family competence protein [Lacisediminihabitans profunda]TXN32841.1 MBL fold metallo-hydrolase [Lacisediminihabitans profunda]
MTLDLRLAAPVVVAWIVVGVLIGAPDALVGAAVATWAATVAAGGWAALGRRHETSGVVVVAIVALAASAMLLTVAAVQYPHRQPHVLVAAAHSGRYITVTAVTAEVLHPGMKNYGVTVTEASVGSTRIDCALPVTVFGEPPPGETTGIGTELTLGGTLVATDPADDVSFLLFASKPPTLVAPPPWYLDWANGLRSGLGRAASGLPGSGGGLLPGLAIGDTSAVSPALGAAMKATSLSHLTAVSGANCAVVIALIMLAGAALGLSRRWRIAASLVVLLGFVVLVTPQPSVLRSAVMATLVLVATAAGRPVRGVSILSLASVILLAVDPWLSRSYGFILSVLATGGLLILAGPITRLLARRLPTWVAAIVAIPLAAQLACQPVLVLLNPVIPTYGVLANMLAEPAAPLATVLGLAACLVLAPLPAIGHAIAWVAWLPAAWIAAVAQFFAGLPGSAIPWPAGAPGVALAALATAAGLLAAFPPRSRALAVRRVASAGLALLLVGYLGVAGGERLRVQLGRPGDWQIAVCDVGQGDAVLVRSLGRLALIDTGPKPERLTRCLDSLGIGRIDLLVLTHYDLDHVGGTDAVVGRVDRAMIGPRSDAGDDRLAHQLAASGAAVEQVSRGLTGTLGELRWEVLWPRSPLAGVQPGNDASVTMRFRGAGACASGCLSSIFLGDLGNEPQARMMAANRIAEVDVVKVAHHGSADQNEDLYAKLHATIGLIGVGADNTYGHPTDKLLGILARVATTAARTDRDGMILVSTRPGGGLAVWTERSPPALR